MNEEMKSLQKNSTWKVVELPKGKKPVGCRWVFTIKYKANGTIEQFKTRLVAKGYTKTYGIDYMETFALVAKINIVRILISLAVNLDWPLHQFDVKNACLVERRRGREKGWGPQVFSPPPSKYNLSKLERKLK